MNIIFKTSWSTEVGSKAVFLRLPDPPRGGLVRACTRKTCSSPASQGRGGSAPRHAGLFGTAWGSKKTALPKPWTTRNTVDDCFLVVKNNLYIIPGCFGGPSLICGCLLFQVQQGMMKDLNIDCWSVASSSKMHSHELPHRDVNGMTVCIWGNHLRRAVW